MSDFGHTVYEITTLFMKSQIEDDERLTERNFPLTKDILCTSI